MGRTGLARLAIWCFLTLYIYSILAVLFLLSLASAFTHPHAPIPAMHAPPCTHPHACALAPDATSRRAHRRPPVPSRHPRLAAPKVDAGSVVDPNTDGNSGAVDALDMDMSMALDPAMEDDKAKGVAAASAG